MEGSHSSSAWRDAVMEEGAYVMLQVTTRLYKGGSLRPDEFYKSDYKLGGRTAYKNDFGPYQRAIIEQSGNPYNYNIKEAAKEFDISLHWVVIQKLCGLHKSTRLYRSLSKLVSLRNQVAHNVNSRDDLEEELSHLGSLYDDILDDLEDATDDYLWPARQEVIRRMNQRKLQAKPKMSDWMTPRQHKEPTPSYTAYQPTPSYTAFQPTPSYTAYQPTPSYTSRQVSVQPGQRTASKDDEDNDLLGNFGKAMAGMGIGSALGIGAGLLGAALLTSGDDSNTSSGESQKKGKEKEPEYQGWGTMGAAIGAGVGLIGALASMDFGREEKTSRNTRHHHQ